MSWRPKTGKKWKNLSNHWNVANEIEEIQINRRSEVIPQKS